MPDNICTQLLPVMRNRYITTTEKISYKNALELESLSTAEYPEQTENGNEYSIRFSTLQINSTITGNFIMQTSMIYGAVVLMVICLTVLSLQQLLDAGPYKYRFIAAIIVASVVIVLVILLLCYFISTWVIFRRSVHS